MIHYTNETDEAVRRHYELTDEQYKFYLSNRKWILEKIRDDQLNLRESEDLKDRIKNLEKKAKAGKKRSYADVLEYNVAIQYMEGGVEASGVPQIAKMAGCTAPAIREYKDSAYRDLRKHFEAESEIYENEEFTEEGGANWLN